MIKPRNVSRNVFVILMAATLMAIGAIASNQNAIQQKAAQREPEPYSMQYSDMNATIDFSLGDGSTYYSKLSNDSENLLIFWGSFCPHCENVFDYIKQSDSREIIESNLFTVSEDEDLEAISFHKGEFPILLDSGWNPFDQFKPEHLPSAFAIDGTGNILGSAEGEHDVKALLDEYGQRSK